jgi:predicted transcriptional regulator
MARSFRLDPDLEQRLQDAAAREGVSASVFIRQAVKERCDRVLSHSLLDDLGDGVGSVESGRIDSRHTGRAFADLLVEKYHRNRRCF